MLFYSKHDDTQFQEQDLSLTFETGGLLQGRYKSNYSVSTLEFTINMQEYTCNILWLPLSALIFPVTSSDPENY